MSEMTVEAAKEKLIAWCKSQLGYHESGDNNTKYADADYDSKLYGFDMHGQPWCDYFVDYAFIINFGYVLGTAMTYQNPNGSAACAISKNYYQQNGAYFEEPEVGDQIFFYVSGGINHTGIVVDVSDIAVAVIEGNSSDQVKRNVYYLSDNSIAGYGRPNWGLVTNVNIEEGDEKNEESSVIKTEVKFMQGKYPLLTTALKNEQREDVKALQCLLNLRGNETLLEVDGYYGKGTEAAVKAYQRKKGLLADGECGKDTWLSLITG